MSWAMAEVYGSVTDRILVNMARHFPLIKKSDEIMGSWEYQTKLLAQVGQVNRESVDIIMKSMSKLFEYVEKLTIEEEELMLL